MFPAGRYTAIAYDLRGVGDSSKPPTDYTVAQHVEDLVALMERLNSRCDVLVGHSRGGTIGQKFATSHPELKLALVTSAAYARFTVAPLVTESICKRAERFGSSEQKH